MKALTICQPYAHLIVTPQNELGAIAIQKRVENRTWNTYLREWIAIHAGKGTKFLSPGDRELFPKMAFGAFVGVAFLKDCVEVPVGIRRYPWMRTHPHVEGPFCFILEGVFRLPEPIPCAGAQGFWDVPADVVARLEEAADQAVTICPMGG